MKGTTAETANLPRGTGTDTERETAKMAEKPTYKSLNAQLQGCATISDLQKLATSDDYGLAARQLPADELEQLRDDYRERLKALDGRVRLDVFNGRIVRLVNVEWWHSDTYAKPSSEGGTDGEGVTLFIQPEADFEHDGVKYGAGKRYKASTSSAPIVRFCNRYANAVPSDAAPARVQLQQVPVSDPQRAAAGQKRWDIKQLPMPTSGGGSPF